MNFISKLLLSSWLAIFSTFASSVEIVAPFGYANTEGNSDTIMPFNFRQYAQRPEAVSQRYQQVFLASEFRGVSGYIQSLAFRSDGFSASSFDIFQADIEIRISHTHKVPVTLSTFFQENIGHGEALVLKDIISLHFPTIPEDCSPGCSPFVNIIFSDNFLYNGVDNLLLDIKVFNRPSPIDRARFDAVRGDQSFSGVTASVFSGGGDSVNNDSGIKADLGLVTKFDINPIIVPEPSSLVLLLFGFMAIIKIRNRRYL